MEGIFNPNLLKVVQEDLIELNKILGYHNGEDRYIYLKNEENGWYELRSNTMWYCFGNIKEINSAVKAIIAFVVDVKKHKNDYPF